MAVPTLAVTIMSALLVALARGQTTGMATTAQVVTTQEVTTTTSTASTGAVVTTESTTTSTASASSGIPSQFNWASTGTFGNATSVCSPPVLNQGQCGSCYSFSTALTMGTTLCAANNNDISYLPMSPQYVLDLNYNTNNVDPCDGGWPLTMMNLVGTTSDIATCSNACAGGCLPYNAVDCLEMTSGTTNWQQTCQQESGCVCNSFTQVTCNSGFSTQPLASGATGTSVAPDVIAASSISAIQSWLMTTGPVSVAMDACDTFQTWWSSNPGAAVFPGGCVSAINHAVTIVGWAQINNAPAWIIQNSWGSTSGGDQGFFYIAFNAVGTGSGQTNIQSPTGLSVSGSASSSSSSSSPVAVPSGPMPGSRFMRNPGDTVVIILAEFYSHFHAERISGRQPGRNPNFRLVKIYNATEQITTRSVYRVRMLFSWSEHDMEVHEPTLARGPSGGPEYVLVQSKFTAVSAASVSGSSSSSSSSSTKGMAVGVSVGAGVCVVAMAAIVVVAMQKKAAAAAAAAAADAASTPAATESGVLSDLQEPLLQNTEA